MRILISILVLLLAVAALAVGSPAALAQDAPLAEAAATYSWIHTNAPPSGCGCFSMNGGNASFAYSLTRTIAMVGEVGAVANGNVDSTGLNLTLSNYLVGGRYSLRRFQRLTPFGQVLAGAAHASGSFSPGQLNLGSSTAFAMTAGGGLDLNLSRRFALRLLQTDYYLTLLPNRTNDHQNNFRFSTGIVVRFGRK
jgi:peptidoglycan-associated lipoprotein